MTEDEVRALPVVVDLPPAARVLGLGRNTAYELVRSGAWPTPLLRFGRLIKVPRSSLLELVGIRTTEGALRLTRQGHSAAEVPTSTA